MSAESGRSYWYDDDVATSRGRRILEALRSYQAAEVAMRKRTRHAMSLGENEMLVVRFTLRAQGQGRDVTPTMIARYLGISTASTTALIDRLERSGHLVRAPHPTDRRSIVVTCTPRADHDLRAALGDMHQRMMAATRGIGDDQAADIITFLERMEEAVDEVSAEDPGSVSVTA